MHEQAVMTALRRGIEVVVERERAARVCTVRLRLGALCHLQEADLRSRWPDAMAGTVARDAALVILRSEDLTDPGAQEVEILSVDLDGPLPPAGGASTAGAAGPGEGA